MREHPFAQDTACDFGCGLLRLINDDVTAAEEHLQRGISLNKESPALNADMQRIIDEINNLPAELRPAPVSDDGQHVMLSAYTGSPARY